MKVEMAKNEDLNTVLSIFASAKKYMSGENNFQWGDNYPNLAILNDDLKNNNLYIIKDSHVTTHFAREKATHYKTSD